MSSYVAAGIAKSNQTKTSLIAVKLGITGFILPFFFLNNPLLLIGSVENVSLLLTIRTLITASIGVICLAAGTEGMLIKECSKITRILLVIVGLFAIDLDLHAKAAGLLVHRGLDTEPGAADGNVEPVTWRRLLRAHHVRLRRNPLHQ